MKIFDRNYDGLVKSLDLYYKRHTLVASNIANSETPGFRARDLNFGGALEAAIQKREEVPLATSSPRHLATSSDRQGEHIVIDYMTDVGADGNNVDLDTQMASLSLNTEEYQQSINFLTAKMRLLRSAITNRGGA